MHYSQLYSYKRNILITKAITFYLFSFFFLILSFSCVPSKKVQKDILETRAKRNSIRVLINEAEQIRLYIKNKFRIFNEDNQKLIIGENSEIIFSLSSSKVKLKYKENVYSSEYFKIYPLNEKFLTINKKRYRGSLKIINNNSKLSLINTLDLEDYLKGVILKEMPLGKGTDNLEALKAFIIVARTYAIAKISEGKKIFDIYPDIRDQIYDGLDAENAIINKLIEITKGKILYYKNDIAKVFYHSTCGGYTESVENVFNHSSLPYLKSLADGNLPNCKISPKYKWEKIFTKEMIINNLFEANLITDKNFILKNLKIIRRFKSGRIKELKLYIKRKDKLQEISLFSNNIRYILKDTDNNILPSSNFEIFENENNTVKFKGKGFGHGVGLCQWGSIYLSNIGTNYIDIIQHYFPETEIKVYD